MKLFVFDAQESRHHPFKHSEAIRYSQIKVRFGNLVMVTVMEMCYYSSEDNAGRKINQWIFLYFLLRNNRLLK